MNEAADNYTVPLIRYINVQFCRSCFVANSYTVPLYYSFHHTLSQEALHHHAISISKIHHAVI